MKAAYWRRSAACCTALGLLLLGGCSNGDQAAYRTVKPDTGPVEYRVEDIPPLPDADDLPF